MLFTKKYDVFISYAIEDKFPVAETIAANLKKNGIKVWYVGNELKVGDRISTVISTGLRNSNYCIVILSPFTVRHWPVVELYSFIEKEQLEKKILILPVWHKITYEEAKQTYPIIADRYAASTENGLGAVSESLYKVICAKKRNDFFARIKLLTITGIFLLACLTSAFFIFQNSQKQKINLPSRQFIQQTIQKRVDDFQVKLESSLQKKIAIAKGKNISPDSIIKAYNYFVNLCKHERNEYKFSSENFISSGLSNIENSGISISETPYNAYGIAHPDCFLLQQNHEAGSDTIYSYSFTLLNRLPLTFIVDTVFELQGKIHAHVSYTESIRSAEGLFIYPYKSRQTRKQQIQFTGYRPSEEYIFEIKDDSWNICGVK